MMGSIRQFEAGDVGEVAQLWQRCFRRCDAPASAAVRQYFLDIFLGGPWHHPDYRPLVYVGSDGTISGFMGRMHRPMLYRGSVIHCAVATQLMVDASRKQGFCALELIRAFHAGPHDLAYSDGANESSRRLWERCGGDSCRLLSMEWSLALRPTQTFLGRLQQRERVGTLVKMLQPCSGMLDNLAVRSVPLLRRWSQGNGRSAAVDASHLAPLLDQAQKHVPLRALYTPQTLDWLLQRAAESRSLGDLVVRGVRDEAGTDIGWFVYYIKAGQTAHVLQMGYVPGGAAAVLACLCQDAYARGAASVSGQVDPLALTELSDAHCSFRCAGLGVLVQSRSAELLGAVHRGDTALSRLDGEWWMRFGIDRKTGW